MRGVTTQDHLFVEDFLMFAEHLAATAPATDVSLLQGGVDALKDELSWMEVPPSPLPGLGGNHAAGMWLVPGPAKSSPGGWLPSPAHLQPL